MSGLRIIIVDDEERMRVSIRHLLRMYYPSAQVVAEAADVSSAVAEIRKHDPDVVLLDIQMPGGTGFDLVRELSPFTFKVIFITAYDQYAIQAIKFSALDYLLKPVNPDELVTALDNATHLQQKQQTDLDSKITNLLNNLNSPSRRIVLKTQSAMHLVAVSDIIRCEADRNYTHFILKGGKTLLMTGSLGEFETMLEGTGFFRAHQSHLIQLNCVDRFEKANLMLVMTDNSKVPVAIRKKEQLLQILDQM